MADEKDLVPIDPDNEPITAIGRNGEVLTRYPIRRRVKTINDVMRELILSAHPDMPIDRDSALLATKTRVTPDAPARPPYTVVDDDE